MCVDIGLPFIALSFNASRKASRRRDVGRKKGSAQPVPMDDETGGVRQISQKRSRPFDRDHRHASHASAQVGANLSRSAALLLNVVDERACSKSSASTTC